MLLFCSTLLSKEIEYTQQRKKYRETLIQYFSYLVVLISTDNGGSVV